jgi:transposase-like protein
MRIKRTAEEWATIIDQQKDSGHTISGFCREKGINQNVFYRKQKQQRNRKQGFIELKTVAKIKDTTGTICIGKLRIEVQETLPDDFIVRLIRCVMEANDVVIS